MTQVTADLPQTSPQDSLEQAETAAVMRRAIAALPAAQRQTVTLFYMGERSQAQVAGLLYITEGTVRKRLHKPAKPSGEDDRHGRTGIARRRPIAE